MKKIVYGKTFILIMSEKESNALGTILNDWEAMIDLHEKDNEQRKLWKDVLKFIRNYFKGDYL